MNIKRINVDTLQRYSTIVEQVAISIVNFSTSLFVINIGSVESFGVYSFLFSFSILVSGLSGALIHRQMVLFISPTDSTERVSYFKSSVLHQLLLLGVWLLISVLSYFGYQKFATNPSDMAFPIIASFFLYAFFSNFFELFRQYLYSTDQQIESLKVTLTFLGTVLLLQSFIFVFNNSGLNSVSTGYITLVVGLLAAMFYNRRCNKDLFYDKWPTLEATFLRFTDYFKQGRFGSVGSVITWLQNQSMGPLLMLIAGPLIVGYFNIGRLFAMPLSLISQGLANSTTPTLRRTYINSGVDDLRGQLMRFAKINLLLGSIYIVVWEALNFFSVLNHFITSYNEIEKFVYFWMILMSATVIRYWFAQYFVIIQRFDVLLLVGFITSAVSVTGLMVSGLIFENLPLAMLFIVLGEIFTVLLLAQRVKKYQ